MYLPLEKKNRSGASEYWE